MKGNSSKSYKGNIKTLEIIIGTMKGMFQMKQSLDNGSNMTVKGQLKIKKVQM